MPKRARITWEGLFPFVGAGVLFGLIYNTLFYPRTLVEYVEAGTIGLLLGLVGGVAEHTALMGWVRKQSLFRAVAVRTVVYSVVVAVVLALVLSVEPMTLGECSYSRCFADYLRETEASPSGTWLRRAVIGLRRVDQAS